MTGPSPEQDPAVFLNPWIASACTAEAVARGAVWCWTAVRRRFEIRRLNRIAVLPRGEDRCATQQDPWTAGYAGPPNWND